MIKKIKELTAKEVMSICANNEDCNTCPLDSRCKKCYCAHLDDKIAKKHLPKAYLAKKILIY